MPNKDSIGTTAWTTPEEAKKVLKLKRIARGEDEMPLSMRHPDGIKKIIKKKIKK